jgi:hypothetical protein
VRHDRDQPQHRDGTPTAALDLPDDGSKASEVDQARIEVSRYEKSGHGAGDTARRGPYDPPSHTEQQPGDDRQQRAGHKQQAGCGVNGKEAHRGCRVLADRRGNRGRVEDLPPTPSRCHPNRE